MTTLTFGQLAGLIAALAFLLLVVFLCAVLAKVVKTMNEVNESVKVLKTDADGIAKEVEAILAKSNTLLDDVNHKSKTIDPLFQTVADLSESVSDLNSASRGLAEKVTTSTQNAGKTAMAFGLLRKLYSLRKKKKE
ncbi:DUF948 domain-containing protein [Liquorilactobacillus satsumensis]|uniref:Methyl-accepting chemotaxis-like protein n=1 Tax=Liquorilactobacillus satsumensis DSM 16230 = JCM 12392 TaxID=1423801 RepID=A0A0R1V4K0_9LACO|nr:DUF948 domain-containing protein [Liquorilactobacillus satsumensis]KRM00562.1 methyl-accepting chemotaxis-like protein [Liquorilactobacillus satsumensis DSM 16230 = JCM 12392]MCC7667386.1 DUF948 domain-containing protein [Liquorilactobacillus satsumensis]MCP9313245.1 DUF948 domain-containing protein [Liquorilactobacillus satsumensis]MCP9329497.1 DUF948 domain-containing protein [Liquorilactobacillus satsumensis]MCP9358174.1 DUF948 domain-containing protein [Liquorilactobacillus satsumensis]